MTKRTLNTILRQYSQGVSKDCCRTAIIQLCCPETPRKNINELCDALEYFETKALRIDMPVGEYTATLSDVKRKDSNNSK